MVELFAVLVGRVVAYGHGYGDGVLSGLTGKRGEEGARGGGSGPEGVGRSRGWPWVSPWRREDVGEAATAKQEVEARPRRVDTPLPVGRG